MQYLILSKEMSNFYPVLLHGVILTLILSGALYFCWFLDIYFFKRMAVDFGHTSFFRQKQHILELEYFSSRYSAADLKKKGTGIPGLVNFALSCLPMYILFFVPYLSSGKKSYGILAVILIMFLAVGVLALLLGDKPPAIGNLYFRQFIRKLSRLLLVILNIVTVAVVTHNPANFYPGPLLMESMWHFIMLLPAAGFLLWLAVIENMNLAFYAPIVRLTHEQSLWKDIPPLRPLLFTEYADILTLILLLLVIYLGVDFFEAPLMSWLYFAKMLFFFVKLAILIFLVMWLRNSSNHFKYKDVMTIYYRYLLPTGVGILLINALSTRYS